MNLPWEGLDYWLSGPVCPLFESNLSEKVGSQWTTQDPLVCQARQTIGGCCMVQEGGDPVQEDFERLLEMRQTRDVAGF